MDPEALGTLIGSLSRLNSWQYETRSAFSYLGDYDWLASMSWEDHQEPFKAFFRVGTTESDL